MHVIYVSVSILVAINFEKSNLKLKLILIKKGEKKRQVKNKKVLDFNE